MMFNPLSSIKNAMIEIINRIKDIWNHPVLRRSVLFGGGIGVIAGCLVIALLSVTLPDAQSPNAKSVNPTQLATVELKLNQPDGTDPQKTTTDRPDSDKPAPDMAQSETLPDDQKNAETVISQAPSDGQPLPATTPTTDDTRLPMPDRHDRIILTHIGDNLPDNLSDNLPGGTALAFFTNQLPDDTTRNRLKKAGHPILLHLPMEPSDFPASNPGPGAIMTSAGVDENIDRLRDMLNRADWDGIVIYQGGAILNDGKNLRGLLQAVRGENIPIYVTRDQQTETFMRMAKGYGVTVRKINDRIRPTDSPDKIDAMIARALNGDSLMTIQLPGHPLLLEMIDNRRAIEDNI